MTLTIEVKNVSKIFKRESIIDGLSCSFQSETIYGLLGRNGAGKTTLMKLITGQSLPSHGEILINGESPFNNQNIQSQLCFIKESENFKASMKIKDIVKIAPAYYPHLDQEFALQLIAEFNLPLNKKVSQLSKGMISALGVSIGIASRAPLTIFDEPYIGMDAAARQRFYEFLLDDYSEHPRTIIISTHLIDEISNLFQDVYLMKNGQLSMQESVEVLREKAFILKGPKNEIKPLLKQVTVLEETNFLGEYTVTVLDDHSILIHLPPSVEKHPVTLQQLMVLVTKDQKEAHA
ncbi:ATP-binding cassette domain-containing protein [Bacillus sp. FJAT-45037]|uniref:ATP-binding cassette domain-containing protein n=1 Tax=Bacillus sp. FJAT-45037 TaxID=2011007 RepID=UPI000C24D2B1|nr:ABC transporter ATP-binding protein [Bacillus sp. FJAT-45037]